MKSGFQSFITDMGVYRLSMALLGLLGIAAVLLTLGQPSTSSEPSASSFSPSGTSAFAEIMRRSGYQVTVSHSPNPSLKPTDVAVAFTLPPEEKPMNPLVPEKTLARSIEVQTRDAVTAFVRRGGSALVLPMPRDFQAESPKVSSLTVSGVPHQAGDLKLKLRLQTPQPEMELVPENQGESLSIGSAKDSQALAYLDKLGAGYILTVRDGMLATNRFIGQEDDARALAQLVEVIAPPGSRLVFTEGTWGNASPPSLLESIGAWSLAAWRQLLFLGLVVIYTYGKPFGIPSVKRFAQRGSKELVDAIAGVLERGKAATSGLKTSNARAEALIRKKLKLTADIPFQHVAVSLPEPLATRIGDVARLSTQEVAPMEALTAAQNLDDELESFLRG